MCNRFFSPGVVKVSTLDYEGHFSLNSALTKDYVPVVCIHSEIAKQGPAAATARESSHYYTTTRETS